MPNIKKVEAQNIKRQIYTLHNNNGDWGALAQALGVKKSAAYYWIKKQEEPEKQHGGRRRSKVIDESEYMEQYIEETSKITLKLLKKKLKNEHNALDNIWTAYYTC